MVEYTYRRLPERGWFRLLAIRPATSSGRSLQCRLLERSMDSNRPYECLSYVWGTGRADKYIWIDGKPFLVRPNLYSALKRLRSTQSSRIIWIDAICIDQLNQEERNCQVTQMCRIYSSASRVIIWLGEGDSSTDLAMDMINALAPVATQPLRHLKKDRYLHNEDADLLFDAIRPFATYSNYGVLTAGLSKLCRNDWWRRIWTVQEIVLAREATIYCSANSTSYQVFTLFAAFANWTHDLALLDGATESQRVFAWIVQLLEKLFLDVNAIALFRHYREEKCMLDLAYLASTSMDSRDATNPLDKVYALLGLAEDEESRHLKVDYSFSTADVYTSAFKSMLQHSNDMWPFRLRQDAGLDRHPDLPSWVPDFNKLFNCKTRPIREMDNRKEPVYDASMYGYEDIDYDVVVKFHSNDSILELNGFLVDVVDRVSCSGPEIKGSVYSRREAVEDLHDVLQSWKTLIELGVNPYISGGTVANAFWRTVLLDLMVPGYHLRESYTPKRLDETDPMIPPRDIAGESILIRQLILREARLDAFLVHRRMFVTSRGYIGLGPPTMARGDAVCVFMGSYLPFVVRKVRNGYFSMKGQCYMHGIMDGEIIEDADQGLCTARPFYIV